MNLLFFSHSCWLNGAERSLLELVKLLTNDYNANCTIVLPSDGPLVKLLENAGATTIIAPMTWWCTFDELPSLIDVREDYCRAFKWLKDNLSIFKLINPDVILTNTLVIPWGAVTAFLLQKPHLWMVNEFGQLDFNLHFYHPFDQVLKVIESGSEMIITRSNAIQQELFPKVGKNKIRTIYRYLDIPDELKNTQVMATGVFKIPDAFHLVIVGTISENKGQEDAVRSVIHLSKQQHRAVELIIVGAGTEAFLRSLEKIIHAENAEHYVRILPHQDKVLEIIKSADVLLLCSKMEGFGRVILEAMLMGTAVISTNTGGTQEMVVNEKTGLLYTPGRYLELADQILRLMDQPDFLNYLRENAFQFADQKFSKGNFGSEFIKVLSDLNQQPYHPKEEFKTYYTFLEQLCSTRDEDRIEHLLDQITNQSEDEPLHITQAIKNWQRPGRHYQRIKQNSKGFVGGFLKYIRLIRTFYYIKRSGVFDADYYLHNNPDVKESGLPPLKHFILHGLTEGRNPTGLFDSRFYLENNPDVKENGINPFLHFMKNGWREGRNPSRDFDVKYYLELNPDVKAAGINPLVHYIKYGMSEGRSTKSLNYVDYEEPIPTYSPGAIEMVTAGELTARMNSLLKSDRTVISISNGDDRQPVVDVQVYISQEQKQANQAEQNYLHVYPRTGNELLLEDGISIPLGVNFNGESIGTVGIEALMESLQGTHTRIVDVDIHHTMGWNLSSIDSILELSERRGNFWVHDYFSFCPSFNLLRNSVEFCGAPEISSNACTLCRYSNLRARQQARFKQFFTRNALRVIAPSRYALDLWLSKAPYMTTSSELRPLAALNWLDLLHLQDHHNHFRIGYIGSPIRAKGWDAWLRLVSALDVENLEYFHFSSVEGEPGNYTRIQTPLSPQMPFTMIDVLKETKIDAVFLWSIWPETFSIALHEALAAGCFIITNRSSGNIQDYLTKNPHHGAILEDEADLHAFISNGELARRIEEFRAHGKPQADLIWM